VVSLLLAIVLRQAGSIDFFARTHKRGEKHAHGQGGTFDETLDITQAIMRLQRDRRWNSDELSVTLRPLAAEAPRGQEEAARKRAEETAEGAKVSYRRVNVLVTN
jgi:hypothetical protein